MLYTSLHTCGLITKKTSLQRLQVTYNEAMRILLRKPRWSCASEMFVAAGINILQAVLRNLMYKCFCRVNESENEIIMDLSNKV